MNRRAVIFAAILLLFQTLFSGLTGSAFSEVSGENKVLTSGSISLEDEQVVTIVEWSNNNIDVTEGYSESLALVDTYVLDNDEEVDLSYEETSGTITFADGEIGEYSVSDEGEFSITFNERVEFVTEEGDDVSGTVKVVANIVGIKDVEKIDDPETNETKQTINTTSDNRSEERRVGKE